MTALSLDKLTPRQARVLAVALAVAAVVLVFGVLLLPIVLMHAHYSDLADQLGDRIVRYRRVAAQAPEYRAALERMKEKGGAAFYLKNRASNLAGAELQEAVRAAIEGNGGRITTSQNAAPKDEGRYKQIMVNVQFFANTANLQKILNALETQQPYLSIENITLRPLNAFRGFKPAPGQEPEINVQLDVAAYAFAEPEKK